jgi:hypothetical protein
VNQPGDTPGQFQEHFGGHLTYSPVQVHPFSFASFNGHLSYYGNSDFSVDVNIGLVDPVAVAVRFVNGPENGVSAYTNDLIFLSNSDLIYPPLDAVRLDFRGEQGTKGQDYYYLSLWDALDFFKKLPFSVITTKAHKAQAKRAS